MSNRSRNFDNITAVEAAHRAGVLAGLERAAQLLEDRFGERVQRRHATNAIRSQKEKP